MNYELKNTSKYVQQGLFILLFLAGIIFISSCENFVNNIKDPINVASDAKLTNPNGADFLATGVLSKFAVVHGQMILYAGGLSDELIFVTGSYEPWDAIDKAEIAGGNPLVPTNSWLQPMMNDVAVLLYYADSLVIRVKEHIKFSTPEEMAIRTRALYTGYFFGAVSRFYWAAYWGLEPNNPSDNGGGVINLSPYISASKMYEDANALLDSANNYADALQKKYINTLKARLYLYTGNFGKAKTYSDLGLSSGDLPFQVPYTSTTSNFWSMFAGPGYPNYFADNRFKKYTVDDPDEVNRIPVTEWKVTVNNKDTIAYLQGKYANQTDPINFLTWQENSLMKAELAIRSGDNAGGLASVNEIRVSHNIKQLTASDVQTKFAGKYLDMLYEERDKELCFTGIRLNDERRFDKWHLDKTKTWQFLPISDTERRMNPNLKK